MFVVDSSWNKDILCIHPMLPRKHLISEFLLIVYSVNMYGVLGPSIDMWVVTSCVSVWPLAVWIFSKFLRNKANIFALFIIFRRRNTVPPKAKTWLPHITNIVTADVLATQGGRASAAIALVYLEYSGFSTRKVNRPGYSVVVVVNFEHSMDK